MSGKKPGSTIQAIMAGISAVLFAQSALAGTASISVEVSGPGSPTFTFAGVVSGTVPVGESISKAGLGDGAYTSWDTGATPGFQLEGITCDDDNSAGYVSTRTARFIIDGEETVNCTFRYRKDLGEPPSPGPASGPDSGNPVTETEPPEETEEPPPPEINVPEQSCLAPDLVPREGVWMVSNLPGTMVCAGMSMPLTPSSEPGRLELRECGWTVIGSGFSDDTADLTMRATDSSGKHYTGTVGGAQDGIPMNIDFKWTLESDSYITGSLYSQVTQQGMTCTMNRSFEMTFTSQ